MNSTTTLGLDLAKEVFQVHGVDAQQKITVRRQLKRKDVLAFFAELPPCLVGIEACGSAHYWAREIGKLGHTVKLLVPRDVKAFVRRSKTDAADAAAICTAVRQDASRSVPIKSAEQQCLQMLHKVRDGFVANRTKTSNQVRAHLSELGIVTPTGVAGFNRLCEMLRDEAYTSIPLVARAALLPLLAALETIERAIADLDKKLHGALRADETSRRLATIPGVGTLAATAFAAAADEIRTYASARNFAASLGLTPRINGTGGKVTLGPISKQGNGLMRRLLYLGAVSRLAAARRNPGKTEPKLLKLLAEKAFKVAAIALANKNARTIWALIVRGGTYIANHQPPNLRAVFGSRAQGCQ